MAECIRFEGRHDADGYGRMSGGRKAHRVVWEQQVGPIPPGLTIDHVYARGCRFRDCIAIEHLEPVTQAENARRRKDRILDRGTCVNGHAHSTENLYELRGTLYCRVCNREAAARARAARGASL